MLAISIESQYAIAHAARGDQFPVLDRQLMNQGVGVYVIEVVADGYLWRLAAEDCGEIRILAVEVQDVCYEMSLLQEKGTARQIGDPWLRLFGPHLVAGKPLSKGAKGEARSLVDERLVHRGMDDKPVQAHREFLVGCGFQGRRRPCPRTTGGGERLSRDQVLSVN